MSDICLHLLKITNIFCCVLAVVWLLVFCASPRSAMGWYMVPELQCLLKVKEDLSSVLIFQDAKNNVSNWLIDLYQS